MTKPVDEIEMLLRIKALLRRAKIANDRKIEIGDVIIDYDSLTVKKHNEITELPQKEFMLLYKLLSYPGKIFTRIQLMDEIWGTESQTGWETVTVHIGRLRKRFEGWEEFQISFLCFRKKMRYIQSYCHGIYRFDKAFGIVIEMFAAGPCVFIV